MQVWQNLESMSRHQRGVEELVELLLQALIESSEAHGIWTLQSATIPENDASLALQARCGFRVVGRRERIGKLAGVWYDTILTERRSTKVGVD